MTGPAIPPRPEGSPQSPPPSPAPEAPRSDPADPAPPPARPRIRPAQSEKWDREPEPSPAASASAAAASGPATGTPGAAAGGQAGIPQGHWSGPNGQLYYRAADGQDYYQASDGKFYPVAALLGQQTAGTSAAATAAQTPPAQGTPEAAPDSGEAPSHPAPGASAADDRSTYYEYIAAHTGEQRVTSSAAPSGPVSPAGPPPQPGRRRTGLTIVAAVAATALVAVAVFFGLPLLSPDEDLQPSQEPTEEVGGKGGGPAEEGSGTPALPAAEQLKNQVDKDHPTVASNLDGHWVVQLSAKAEGLTTEHRTWTSDDILDEFESLRQKYPEALLLNSSQWTSFQLDDYWITVLNQPYDDPESALAKCTQLGIDRDNCFAKKISSTEGPEGTTKLNP